MHFVNENIFSEIFYCNSLRQDKDRRQRSIQEKISQKQLYLKYKEITMNLTWQSKIRVLKHVVKYPANVATQAVLISIGQSLHYDWNITSRLMIHKQKTLTVNAVWYVITSLNNWPQKQTTFKATDPHGTSIYPVIVSHGALCCKYPYDVKGEATEFHCSWQRCLGQVDKFSYLQQTEI